MNKLDRLLQGRYPDPRTGKPLQVPIRSIVVAESLAGREADLLSGLGLGRALAVVSDPETEEALGARVKRVLAGRFTRLRSIVLPSNPRPDQQTTKAIEQEGRDADAFIAVGSGTINDLCKNAAARCGKPYAVFATAPSMNGYASMNASIEVAGLKRTLPARAPEGVFMDLGVLAASPAPLIRAGVGDTLCRATVQADWLLAHRVRGDAFQELPFQLLAEEEAALLAEPEALLAGDLQAVAGLARALILAGLGMSYCGGSSSTSQGEHLISHYLELRGNGGGLHGERIGVTTITMARLQERLLEREALEVFPCTLGEPDLLERYGPELGRECWREFAPKRLDQAGAAALNRRLREDWPKIRKRLTAVMLPPERIRGTLARLGAPTEPGQLGWSPEAYGEALRHAAELRNRYTFLDLARDSRLSEPWTA